MTSKKYSLKLSGFTFRKALRENWVFVLLGTAFVLISFGGVFDIIHASFSPIYAETLKKTFTYCFAQFYDSIPPETIMSIPFVFVSAVLAIRLFWYVMNKAAVNVHFSIALNRGTLFASKFLAGITIITMSIIIPWIFIVIANIAFFGFYGKMLLAALYIVIKLLSASCYVFAVVALVMQIVGSMLETFVYSSVAILSPFMVNFTLSQFISTFIYGSPYTETLSDYDNEVLIFGKGLLNTNFTFVNFSRYLLPGASDNDVISLASERKELLYDPESFGMKLFGRPLVFLAVIAVITAAAYFCARHRKAEKAGFMGTSPLMQGFCVVVVGSFLAALFNHIVCGMDLPFRKMVIISIIGGIVIMAVGYTVVELIVLRSFKRYRKRIKYLLAEIAVFLLICLLMLSALPVGSVKIPDASDIKSADIVINGQEVYASNIYYGYSYGSFVRTKDKLRLDAQLMSKGERTLFEGFTDKADIDKILSVNGRLASLKNDSVSKFYGGENEHSDKINAGIVIRYHLKDGKTSVRNYKYATLGILEEILSLTNSGNIRKQVSDYVKNLVENAEILSTFSYNIGLVSPSYSRAVAPVAFMNKQVRRDLVEALAADILAGTMPLSGSSDAQFIGYVFMAGAPLADIPVTEYDEETGEPLVTGDMGNIEIITEKTDILENNVLAYPVYADMENTLNFLDSNGMTRFFKSDDKAVKVVYCKYTEPADVSRYENDTFTLWGESYSDRHFQYLWANQSEDELYYTAFGGEYAAIDYVGPTYEDIDEKDRVEIEDIMPENAVTVTQESELAKLQSAFRPRYSPIYDGYYAVMVLESGRVIFGYIPESLMK